LKASIDGSSIKEEQVVENPMAIGSVKPGNAESLKHIELAPITRRAGGSNHHHGAASSGGLGFLRGSRRRGGGCCRAPQALATKQASLDKTWAAAADFLCATGGANLLSAHDKSMLQSVVVKSDRKGVSERELDDFLEACDSTFKVDFFCFCTLTARSNTPSYTPPRS
jgi:hypothetical protein